MGTVQIIDTTTRNPITIIGERAGICWGADTTDAAANYKRGWDCITSGHGRTLEFVEVSMILDGYSARVMREWYTHIGGARLRLKPSQRRMTHKRAELDKYKATPVKGARKALWGLYGLALVVIAWVRG